MTRTSVMAHGIGGRQDLPIPFEAALVGAGVAVTVSFAAMVVLWRRPRLSSANGRPLPRFVQAFADHALTRGALRLLGLATLLFVVVAALLGPDGGSNPAQGFIFVLLWVGLVPLSLLFGPVWKLMSPMRSIQGAISSLAGRPASEGLVAYPQWLGYWPATLGLFAFTWLELVSPSRTSSTVLLWITAYVVVQLIGGTVFGSEWFSKGDPFEVYSSFIGRLAPIGRSDEATPHGDAATTVNADSVPRVERPLVLRNPLDGLDGLRVAPGIVAVVSVLLGSTVYDSISEAPFWLRFLRSSSMNETALQSLGLLAAVLLVAGVFSAAVMLAGYAATIPRRGLPAAFAHSIVPIAVGYLIAHYFSLLVFEGQRTLILASDPLDSGANLLGLTGKSADFTVLSATTIASVQVTAIVVGHIVGVIAAHDRAVRLFPPRHATISQLPLAVLMIAYTVGGLALLYSA